MKTPWVLALLVTLVLTLLVWVLGPLVAIAGHIFLEGIVARFVATVLLMFGWGLFVALYTSRQRKRALADPDKVAVYEQKALSLSQFRQEVDYIKERVRTAIKIVTTSNFYGPKSRSRYALPWYLILGTENCGKTSMLLNSGLKFPINEQADRHLYTLKATEHCEILYGNEAVFIDTPGAYTTSHSDTPANRVWKALLRRLFSARPARPVNGIIVCISMRDLIDTDQTRREHLARTIRTRLGEILKTLRSYAPVYLVFTKCDAVPGFAQFFANLSRSEREQIFGCPAKTGTMEPGTVRLELRELMQTLNAQIIAKIHQERDLPARGEMFRFPQELASLGPRIEDFIAEAFGPSRYHKPVMFRGFFFTSALSSRDVMAAAAREGELSFQTGFTATIGDYAKGFFLLRLLERCIIPEARLATSDKERVWVLRIRRYGMQLAAVVLFLFSGVFLGTSFINNYSALENLDAVYAAFDAEQKKTPVISDAGAALPELEKIIKSTHVYDPEEDSFVMYGFGLYQGKTFDPATHAAYLGTLNTRLMPAIRSAAAQKVETSLDNVNELKNALRAYLMLCQPKRLNEKFITGWLDGQWSERYMGQADTQKTLRAHMDYLIAHGIVPVEPDIGLVERARKSLLKIPLAELVYQRMQEASAESGKAPFTFRAAIGASPFTGDAYPIPALYTREGYEEYLIKQCPGIIRSMTEESWIFGANPVSFSMLDVSKVHKDVRIMYFRDYTKYWSEAIKELRVRTPTTMADAQKLAEQLTTGTSPSVLVLREIRSNTNFIIEDEDAGQVEGALKTEATRKAQQRLARITGTRVASAVVGKAAQNIDDLRKQAQDDAQREAVSVRQYFVPLDSLLDASGNPNPALAAVSEATAGAGEYFSRFVTSDNKEQRVLAALLEIADERDDTLRRLENAVEKLPGPVRDWYGTVVSGGLRDMLAVGARSINRAYQERVVRVYNKNLRSCYPFAIHSERDVNLEDFSEFFRADGVLDNFYDSCLRPFVSKNGRLRSIMGRSLPISGQAVAQLQRANRIQDAFFMSGQDIGISFLMEPYALDDTLKQVALATSGKTLNYWHGPVQGTAFAWPSGTGETPHAVLDFTDLNGIRNRLEARGEWALFRLLQAGSIKRQDGNTCLIEVRINGKWAQFLVQFRTRANPFDPKVCSVTLPASL
ncbi:type VI secretion system membrane subunit TssM [Desulfosarcina sp. OttesenSCG-928-G10]|nr:type VI secretion system membrane subunit TssM [Desulfosarcina sp. OttesenSCG-928-G10]